MSRFKPLEHFSCEFCAFFATKNRKTARKLRVSDLKTASPVPLHLLCGLPGPMAHVPRATDQAGILIHWLPHTGGLVHQRERPDSLRTSEQAASYLHNARTSRQIRGCLCSCMAEAFARKSRTFRAAFGQMPRPYPTPKPQIPTPSTAAPQNSHLPSLICRSRMEKPTRPMTRLPQLGHRVLSPFAPHTFPTYT